MMKSATYACFSAILISSLMLGACGTDPGAKGDRIEISGSPMPSPFHVGDTSEYWKTDRTTVSATARESTEKNYGYFHLVSSDTTVVKIYSRQALVGVAPGTAQVTARDEKSDLVSESSVKVTIVSR